MLTIGKMALAITTGGFLLGALLGQAADPVMKQTPEATRGPLPRAAEVAAPDDAAALLPLDPVTYPDSYAPTWADEVVTDWEPDYPSWTYSEFDAGFVDEVASLEAEDLSEPVIDPPPENRTPPPDGLGPLY